MDDEWLNQINEIVDKHIQDLVKAGNNKVNEEWLDEICTIIDQRVQDSLLGL